MKICTTELEYICLVAESAQRACKRYGYLPSVLIAQSCLENGFGIIAYFDNPEITKLLEANNVVGLKSLLLNDSWDEYTVWNHKSITKKTPEEYNGKMVTIKDDFRVYDSIEQSFCDFLLFLTYASNYGKGGKPKYGQEVLSIKDPETLIKRTASLGYATGSTYPSSVMRIINKHGLTRYDDLSGIEPSMIVPDSLKLKYGLSGTTAPTTNVKKLVAPKFIDNRAASKSQVPAWRDKSDKKYIVVHYLGVVGQNFELWDNGYGATFTIAWNGDVYYTADYTAVTWQCGGKIQGESKDGDGVAPHRFYGQCTNYNSVSIETCVKRTDNKYEGDDNDDKWYFTEESQESLVWAVSKMMDDLNIPIDRVIRHFDVTGKICPNPYVRNKGLNGNWTWKEFKANLAQYRKDGTITIPDRSKKAEPTVSGLSKGDKGDDVKTMQKMLIACGYSCGTAGADGDFGSKTLAALKAFQTDKKLTVSGIYDAATKTALENAYKALTETTKAQDIWLNAVKAVCDRARTNGYSYGNSTTLPPCEDKKISCDRLIARALWDLGYTDQPKGGITCGHMEKYLPKFGFTKVTDRKLIKPGAVVAVKNKKQSYINHVFVIKSYNPQTDRCDRYDTGSNYGIQKDVQPFKNQELVFWTDREFVAAWNIPDDIGQHTEPVVPDDPITTDTVWNGVDYKYVYNYTYYKKKYADLQKAFGSNKAKYFEHFYTFGMKEGRQASASFNVQAYQKRYVDLRNAFGNELPLYYWHYCVYGRKENRKTT